MTQDFVRLKNKAKNVVELFMVVLLWHEKPFISIPKYMIRSIVEYRYIDMNTDITMFLSRSYILRMNERKNQYNIFRKTIEFIDKNDTSKQ